MTLWSMLGGLLPICCTPETNAEEIKFPEIHAEGYAMPVISGAPGGRESNYYSPCCDQNTETNEVVVVVPSAPSVPARLAAMPNESPPQAHYPDSIATVFTPMPIPVPGPAVEAYETMSMPRYQDNSGPPPPVPAIKGLSNLSRLAADVSARDSGDMEVDLRREGPQWSNLGMLVSPNAANQDNLNIDHIDECSLLGDWNAKRLRPQQVWEGDVIVAVNGRTGRDLIREIQQTSDQGSAVNLKISRWSQNRSPTG